MVCKDMDHLETFCEEIMGEGGEGIILRDPTEVYSPGRSHGYLKYKVRTLCPYVFFINSGYFFTEIQGC